MKTEHDTLQKIEENAIEKKTKNEGKKSKEKRENDLGRDPIGSLLVRLALPSITAQLVNMLYNIVDRIYIGHIPGLGATALTGVGVCFPVILLISAFSSLVGMGGAPRAAIKMGQGEDRSAEKVVGNCLTVLLCFSAILTVFFLFAARPLLLAFGASSQTLPYGLSYLNIYVCGTVFVQLGLGMNPFISAQGFAKISMMTVLIGAAINIVLDPVFIFGFSMGVRGAALATVIAQMVSATWVLKFLLGSKTKLRIRKENLCPKLSIILPVLALGVSPFIMQSTECLVNIALNSSLHRYGGDLAVGAMTILTSVMQILSMPVLGMTQGGTPIISFNYGAGNVKRVKRAYFLMLRAILIFTCTFWASVMLFPKFYVSIFNTNPDLLATASWALRIYMGGTFLLGLQTGCQQTFLALGQAKVSLLLALLRKIILLIPLVYILPQILTDQVFAVFLAEPIADVIAATSTGLVFLVQFRKILRRMEKKTPLPEASAREL